jgi:predicted DNA-binding protein
MEVPFSPEFEKQLNDLAAKSGRGAAELVQDVVAGYVDELADMREMLDGRYDDLKSGRVKPVDGEAFFEQLRQREDVRPKRSPQ